MSVSSTTTKVSYAGNGSTTVFAYTFKIFAAADLEVIVRSANGTETTKTLTTHYSVSGAGEEAGGNVTMVTAPASGETLFIRRNLTLTQGTDYVENDPFPANSHENALDRLTFITQGIQEELDRAIKASKTNTISSVEFAISAADRANKIFAFDGSGDLSVTQELGTFQGDWAAATDYNARDIVKDTSNNNIYLCNTSHTSSGAQPLSSNADSAKWDLLVDAASATSSASAAASSAAAASTSESNAASSASAASTSASNAATSASAASTSASNSASSASAASTSASNAASSASAAASSASAAASSATSAAASAASVSVSVIEYGATGDGVTDDTVAIQSALDSGNARVRVPAGTYIISTSLNPAANQEMVIEAGATLKLANAADTPIIEIDAAGTVISGFGTLDGNSANQTSGFGGNAHGIRIAVDVGGWTIQDIHIEDTESQAIRFTPGGTEYADWAIRNVIIDTPDDHGIHVTTATGGLITGCRINSSTRAGIVIVGSQGTVIDGNHCRACGNATAGQAAYYLEGTTANGVVFSNNTAQDCTENAFRNESGQPCAGASFIGNTMHNCSTGMVFNKIENATIIGNTFDACTDRGINMSQGRNNLIQSNTFRLTNDQSIHIQGGNNVQVVNNLIQNGGQTAAADIDEEVGISVQDYATTGDKARDVVIRGNTIVDDQTTKTMQRGIRIEVATEGVIVDGNLVSGMYFDGIYINSSEEVTVRGNRCSRNGRHGIQMLGCVYASVTDNDCYDNGLRVAGSAGIHIEDTVSITPDYFTITHNRTYDEQTEAFTFTSGDVTGNVITETAHGLWSGQRVQFTTTGTLPSGLSLATDYYILKLSDDTFSVSTTFGGSAVALSNGGSGTHTATLQQTQAYGIRNVDAHTNPYRFDFNFAVGNQTGNFDLTGVFIGGKHCTPVKPYATASAVTVSASSTKFVVNTGLGLDYQLETTMAFDTAPAGLTLLNTGVAYSTTTNTQWGAAENTSGNNAVINMNVFVMGGP